MMSRCISRKLPCIANISLGSETLLEKQKSQKRRSRNREEMVIVHTTLTMKTKRKARPMISSWWNLMVVAFCFVGRMKYTDT